MEFKHVPGEKKGEIKLYALSTCGWCKKTKNLLDQLGVEYYYMYVDLLEREERDAAVDRVKKWNPLCSFPTLVINDEKCIVGFKESEIRKMVE